MALASNAAATGGTRTWRSRAVAGFNFFRPSNRRRAFVSNADGDDDFHDPSPVVRRPSRRRSSGHNFSVNSLVITRYAVVQRAIGAAFACIGSNSSRLGHDRFQKLCQAGL